MIQDALQKFEEYKQNRLKENQSRGKSLSTQVESYREELNRRKEKLAEQGKKDYNITIMGHASATLPILDK